MKALRAAVLVLLAAAAGAQTRTQSPRSYQISGRVVNSVSGNPVAGAEVGIGAATNPQSLQTAISAADGRFFFPGLAPGKYWLMAEGKGFRRQGFEEHQGYFTGIAVGPGLKSEGLEFRLQPDAAIEGVINDEQNDPVPDAQVLVFRNDVEDGKRVTAVEEQTTTDDVGHYRVAHLAPGPYYLAVLAHPWYAAIPGAEGLHSLRRRGESSVEELNPESPRVHSPLDVAYPTTYYPGTTDAVSASPLILKPADRATADFNLAAVPALQLRVHVTSPGAPSLAARLEQPLGGAQVPVSIQQSTQRESGGGQQIVLSGVPPGQYRLSIRGFGQHPETWTQALTLTADTDLTLPSAPASVAVHGMVKFVGGWPKGTHPALQLRSLAPGEEWAAPIFENGAFDLREQAIRPGAYEVSLAGLFKAAVSSISAVGARVAGDNVAFGTAPAQLEVLASQALGQVEGTALRGTAPVSGAMVVLVPDDFHQHQQLFRRDQSDSDGTFSLRNGRPGKYTVLAIENGWELEWQVSGVLDPYLPKGTEIEVGGGKSAVKVQVQ